MAAAFTSSEDLARWLEGKPHDVASCLAMRASLRVVPALARMRSLTQTIASRHQLLRTFRTLAINWAIAAFPGKREAFVAASLGSLSGSVRSDVQRAAEYATASAKSDVDAVSVGFAQKSVSYAVEVAASIGRRPLEDFLRACATDAEILDQRSSPVVLSTAQLWPASAPKWCLDANDELRVLLRSFDEGWDVWTEWYEDRLKGNTPNQTLETARATVPDDVWKSSSRANEYIRRLVVEPETFPSVVRRPDLEKQIYSLPYSQALVIGLRASLRALPLFDLEITNEPEFASELLAVLRVVSSCWIAATFPDQTHHRIQSQAALANGIGAQHPLARAVIEANTYSSVEAQLRSIATIVVGAIEDLRIYATSLDGHAAGVIAGMSVSDDINDLNGTSAVAIAQLALWPGGTPPEWTTLRWDNLKRKLISLGVGWEVWVNWYEDRLAGNTRSQEHEFVYTNVPDDMWADGPARVNTWISRTIERSHSSKSVENPPTIPAQKAAAIEPIWRNGRLTLKNTAAKADLKGGAFAAALRGLREELQTFADDITNEVNIDKRFVAIVRRLVDQIPSKPPLQAEIFRLGHAETIFSGYANTVNTEWPPALAAQYHALSLHFDRILRQVPLWREFKRNAANDVFSQSQVQEAALLATELATTLRFEEANTLIDPAIPEAVEGLAQTLKAALTANSENPEAAVKAGLELLAYDVVESVNNILKSIFEVAIWTGIPTTLKKAGAKFNTEAQKSIITEAGRIGKHVGPTITKWAKRTAYATIATTGHHYYGKPLLLWLAANYSDAFSWLVPIVKWF